jgi:hypothetical protein
MEKQQLNVIGKVLYEQNFHLLHMIQSQMGF